ncbi:MAG: M50 family metallopeptidase [Planctomycetes bacterium]|nr:M50 family metallopeptidase [Planctomycetota bacterium]
MLLSAEKSWSRYHPLSWSLPFVTVRGCSIRLHALFVVWGASEILISVAQPGASVQSALACVYAMLAVVLCREMMRAALDRGTVPRRGDTGWSGRQTSVMWPGGAVCAGAYGVWGAAAGGVARFRRVRHAVVGLACGAVLVGVASGTLLASGASWEMLVFNPLHPSEAIRKWGVEQGWMLWAWWLYAASVVAFLMNLIPLRPMDGGVLAGEVLSHAGWESQRSFAGVLAGAVLIGLAVAFDSTRGVALVACCAWWSLSNRGEVDDVVFADEVDLSATSDPQEGHWLVDALTRLRTHGPGALTGKEISELDQIQADLRDHLHLESDRQTGWRSGPHSEQEGRSESAGDSQVFPER